MIKINKQRARRLYNEGTTIYILPCKVRLGNIWIDNYDINNKDGESFENKVNNFEYYNCNNELGLYSAYYVEGLENDK